MIVQANHRDPNGFRENANLVRVHFWRTEQMHREREKSERWLNFFAMCDKKSRDLRKM